MAVVFSCQFKMGIISIYVSRKKIVPGGTNINGPGAYLGGPNIFGEKWIRGPYLGGFKFVMTEPPLIQLPVKDRFIN